MWGCCARWCLLAAIQWHTSLAAVTQSGTLKYCAAEAGEGLGSTNCESKLTLSIQVFNGQNETEPLQVRAWGVGCAVA